MRVKTTPSPLVSSTSSGRRESVSQTSLRWRTVGAVAWMNSGANVSGGRVLPELSRLVLEAYGVVFLLTIIFFCLWLWRAARTVRRLGVTLSHLRPSTAVTSFFVPLMWWWQPYATVRTIWQAAMDPNDWDNVAISQSLPLWWIMWIGQWVAAVAVVGIEMVVMGAEKHFLQTTAIWIFAGCGVVSALSLITVIVQASGGLRRQLRNRTPAAH
jgi:hypothetical protein